MDLAIKIIVKISVVMLLAKHTLAAVQKYLSGKIAFLSKFTMPYAGLTPASNAVPSSLHSTKGDAQETINTLWHKQHAVQSSATQPLSAVGNAVSQRTLPIAEISQDGKNGFGSHLMLDLKGCSQPALNDLELCFAALNNLPAQISMTKISAPHVFRYDAKKENESGITGVVIIAESHISLHTFPQKEYVFIDVFSCKSFDEVAVVEYFKNIFQPTYICRYQQDRGKDFPRD